MLTSVIISLAASGLVAIVAYVALRRSAGSTDTLRDLEAQLGPRLDRMIAEVNMVREATSEVIQQKTLEMQKLATDENREARKESRESLEAVTKSLTERFEKLQESNEKRLEQIRGEVEKKLSETITRSDESYKGVMKQMAALGDTNQRIMQFSEELTKIQSIMQAPKLRGLYGELGMESMLADCLAPSLYATQYDIAGGKVDAVIFNPHGTLPIDSKFPLEAWQRMREPGLEEADRKRARAEFIRAVKKHISDIANKYIRPPDTLDFAVMYLRAEGVYYELLETPELMEHARAARVFPASPLTFWALLQVTVMGFRGMQISESAKRIAALLDGMQGDMKKFRDSFETATKQVRYAGENLDRAGKQLDQVDSKLTTIRSTQIDDGAGVKAGIETAHKQLFEE